MKIRKYIELLAKFLVPRLGEVLFAAIFAAAIAFGPRMMNVDGDLGRHITLGDYVLDSRTIPTSDPFSFTKQGDPLTPHEWLADVIFAAVHRLAGLDGVVWLTALVVALSAWLVYKHSMDLSKMSILALVGGLLGAAASSVHWLTRPHIFTILFSAIWAMELEKVRLGLKKGWLLFPAMMVVWANLHGAFIAGLVIWGLVFLGEILEGQKNLGELKILIWIGPSSILASLLNPDGFGIWKTGFGFLGNQYLVSHTAEYLPPDFQNPVFWPFLMVVGISILVLGLSSRRMSISQLFLLGSWTAMALYSARNIPLYIVIAVPILSDLGAKLLIDSGSARIPTWFLGLQRRIDLTEREIKGGAVGLIVVLVSLGLLLGGTRLDFQSAGNGFSDQVFPVAAVDWLEENPQDGNSFNYFPWGGYLLYRLWPEQLVFIDGQTDFYGEDLTREYEQVITLEGDWRQVFRKYDISRVIMPAGSSLADYLSENPEWDILYQDSTSKIFVAVEGN